MNKIDLVKYFFVDHIFVNIKDVSEKLNNKIDTKINILSVGLLNKFSEIYSYLNNKREVKSNIFTDETKSAYANKISTIIKIIILAAAGFSTLRIISTLAPIIILAAKVFYELRKLVLNDNDQVKNNSMQLLVPKNNEVEKEEKTMEGVWVEIESKKSTESDLPNPSINQKVNEEVGAQVTSVNTLEKVWNSTKTESKENIQVRPLRPLRPSVQETSNFPQQPIEQTQNKVMDEAWDAVTSPVISTPLTQETLKAKPTSDRVMEKVWEKTNKSEYEKPQQKPLDVQALRRIEVMRRMKRLDSQQPAINEQLVRIRSRM